MGRWYSLSVGSGANAINYTSPDGDCSGALNVEIDVTVMANDVANSGAYVRVWGIPSSQLGPNYNLIKKPISISAGMSAGLPLAKPAQRGLLASGIVFQCFGNHIGLDVTLDLIFNPGSIAPQGTGSNPKPQARNIVLNWQKGKPLQQALQQTLKTGFPDIPIGTFNISSQLVAPQDQIGYHANLQQLALYVRRVSQDILKSTSYPGVSMAINGGQFIIGDGTSPQQSNATIAFEDLVGQPTWIENTVIQFKTVMRADIKFNDVVKLPPGPVTYGANNYPGINQQTLFQGTFTISKIRHVGNFRQPDAAAWVTIFDAYANTPATGSPPQGSISTPEPGN